MVDSPTLLAWKAVYETRSFPLGGKGEACSQLQGLFPLCTCAWKYPQGVYHQPYAFAQWYSQGKYHEGGPWVNLQEPGTHRGLVNSQCWLFLAARPPGVSACEQPMLAFPWKDCRLTPVTGGEELMPVWGAELSVRTASTGSSSGTLGG